MLERHPLPEYPFCRADKIFSILFVYALYLAIPVPCFIRKKNETYPDKMMFCRCGKKATEVNLPHHKEIFYFFRGFLAAIINIFLSLTPGRGNCILLSLKQTIANP